MRQEQWETIRRVARGEEMTAPPVALIIDSPWIPGYLGLSTLDYITMPEVWLEANLRLEREFPEVIFLPGFWAEMGMCAEPSAFGCRISFYSHKTPVAHAMIDGVEQLDRLPTPDPGTDGLMPLILNFYRRLEPRIADAGHVLKMVAARGPLTVATHLMGVSSFLLGLKLEPAATHRLLRVTTTLVRQWLEAQAAALRSPDGILVLDDIAGFLSPKDYLEFAHPYLKEVFAAFPGAVKILHNDTDNVVPFRHVHDLGVHIFNFTHLQPIDKTRALVGPEVCLMGNVPPLDVLAQGTAERVFDAAQECVRRHGRPGGLLLSAGGGTSPGTPGPNIHALARAACHPPAGTTSGGAGSN
jgi:uroporphyrinogen decarboxylase